MGGWNQRLAVKANIAAASARITSFTPNTGPRRKNEPVAGAVLEISGAQTANTNSHDSLKSFSREDKIIDVTAPIGAIEATGISASSGEKIAEFDIIDVAAINDHYEDKAGIKEFDGKTPRDKSWNWGIRCGNWKLP